MEATDDVALIDRVRAAMEEKNITEADLEAQGWYSLDMLDEALLGDVETWLGEQQARSAPSEPPEQEPEPLSSATGRTATQEKMVEEAREAGKRVSQRHADPALAEGYVYDKKTGGYRITVMVEPDPRGRDEKRKLTCVAWVKTAKFKQEIEIVNASAVEGKSKQMALRMIDRVRK